MSIDHENVPKRTNVIDTRSVIFVDIIALLSASSSYRNTDYTKQVLLLLNNTVSHKRTRYYPTEEGSGRARAPIFLRTVSKATVTYRLDEHIARVMRLAVSTQRTQREGRGCREKGGRAREATPANRCHKARTCVRTGEGGSGQSRDVTALRFALQPGALCAPILQF